jgi:mannan endo-1,4-beta-mannosidase
MSTQYNQLLDLGQGRKMVAAAEVGAIPRPSLLEAYQADWLWFAVWGGGFIDNAEWNSAELLQEVSCLTSRIPNGERRLIFDCRRTIPSTS